MPLNFDSSTRPLGALRDELRDEIARVERGHRRRAPTPLMKSRRDVIEILRFAQDDSDLGSDGRRDRRHIEFFDAHRRHERRVRRAERFARLHRHRLADEREIRVADERRHVPAEVLHRSNDLAVLDEEQSVARHAGVEQRLLLRRHAANVPELRDEQSAARLLDHVLDRQVGAFHHERLIRVRALIRAERFQDALLDPRHRLRRHVVVPIVVWRRI